jgi:K+-sensing histidine kinase KdpD
LQNALLYSPPKSAVVITVRGNTESQAGFASIGITNLLEEKFQDDDEHLGLGILLCRKIAQHYNGKLEYIEINGTSTAELQFPREEDTSMPLCSDFADYVAEKYRPAKLFMYEVLAKYRNYSE